MLENLNQASFNSHLNETFRVTLGSDQTLDLALEEVCSGKVPSEDFESFSILFSGPRHIALQQGIHEMTHEQLGAFSLFLVPVIPPNED